MAKSVYELFQNTVQARGDKVAAQYKIGGAWRDVTWNEMDDVSKKCAAALVKLGVQPKQHVSIVANTRLEWILADLGILAAGGSTVPIYQSNLAHECEYILNDSESVAVFVEDKSQLEKMRMIREEIPRVKRVIAFTDEVDASSDWEVTWQDFLKEGEEHLKDHADEVKARSETLTPDDILTLIYTSGTTGKPKGAILTHDCMLYEAEAIQKIDLISPDDVEYLFLPMAHVFAKVLEVCWFGLAHVMAFWEGDQAKIVDNLSEVRPTFMCAVPRIFEKVHAKVVADVVNTPGVKGKLGRWALKKGEEAGRIEQQGGKPGGIGWALAQKLVWAKIHDKLFERFGKRMKYFVSGGAPLGKDIAYFFKYAGFEICEGYGLTETSAATCVNRPGEARVGTVGPVVPGTELKIAQDGEILIRGRGVMKGYWNKPEATSEAIDKDGWFHSGDIGEIDKSGFLRITDRKKDIIVTAGGKNVAPQNIENQIKSKSPLISQVVIHGDQRKYLSAVITLDPDNLTAWAKDKGLNGADVQALSQRPELVSEIENVIKEVNSSLPSYESLKKFKILDHDFTVGDLLTPTLKVKRKLVGERYKEIFDGFYAE